MQTYTVGKLAKKLNVQKRVILQWEENYCEFLEVTRGPNNTRIFTENDLQLLREIKQLTFQNMGNDKIIEHLLQKAARPEESAKPSEQSLASTDSDVEKVEGKVIQTVQHYKDVFEAFESFKRDLLQEVRDEIRNEVRTEVLQEVKKEISKGTGQTVEKVETFASFVKKSSEQTAKELRQISKEAEQTVKTVEDFTSFMVRSSEQTSNELQEISKEAQQTVETIEALSTILTKSSQQTAKDIHQISNRLKKNSSLASSEIKELIETMNQEREYYLQTLEQERQFYRHDITERETIFRDFVQTFREAAAAQQTKAKKWWKPWSRV
ncbi:MerR family transcriptional regulator [Bacillus songklensis]|uniref:MerR family transcriptional regulator n=1 Tax=Bacillus songklensis TaxID=1069116 RepID=A0ABV8B7C2_9BACI